MKRDNLEEKRKDFIDHEEGGVVFSKFLKPINIEVSTENLLALQKILNLHTVSFGLMYGTLLGAVREKNFILHDHDTDLFVFREEEHKIMNMIDEAKKIGFSIGRYTDVYISFVRGGDFIDIYFMEKKLGKYHCDGHVIPAKYLDNLVDYPFIGSSFKVPKDYQNLLAYLYGNDWEIPKKNVSPTHYGLYLRIRYFIKNNSEISFSLISWLKGKLYV